MFLAHKLLEAHSGYEINEVNLQFEVFFVSLPYLSLEAKILMFRDRVDNQNITYFNIRSHILLLC